MDGSTNIIQGMVVEGKLDGGEAPVVISGNFSGELNAVEVFLEEMGVFKGTMNADRVELAGDFNGTLTTEELSVGSTAKVDGELRANSLAIELGAEVIGSVARKS